MPSQLELFDHEIQSITQRRGEIYKHPSDDFREIVNLTRELPLFSDPRFRHIAYMICVKLIRLSKSPEHLDSIIDIAGYARTWAMILERDYIHDPSD